MTITLDCPSGRPAGSLPGPPKLVLSLCSQTPPRDFSLIPITIRCPMKSYGAGHSGAKQCRFSCYPIQSAIVWDSTGSQRSRKFQAASLAEEGRRRIIVSASCAARMDQVLTTETSFRGRLPEVGGMRQKRQNRLRQQAARIIRLLQREYRSPHLGNFREPIKELVYISLTRQTHWPNAQASWKRVVAAGGPQALLRMSVKQVARMISTGGLSRQKAAWIIGSLKRIETEMGTLSLARLSGWKDQRVESFLRSLPGVGIKTARCIMMYSMRRRVLPVDVHVRRLATRIGLVREGLSEREIHAELDALIAPSDRFSFHVNSICHGRQVCQAIRPKCDECTIRENCKFGCAVTRSYSSPPYVEYAA